MISAFEAPTCAVCMEPLTSSLAATPCGHVFHHECLKKSFVHANQCPLDRTVVRDDEVYKLSFTLTNYQDTTVAKYFEGLSPEDRKDLSKLSADLKTEIQQHEQVKLTLACLQLEKETLDEEFKQKCTDFKQMTECRDKLQREISANKNKVEMKQWLADEMSKDLKNEKIECQEWKNKYNELISTSQTLKEMKQAEFKSLSNKNSPSDLQQAEQGESNLHALQQWASNIRKYSSIEEQAQKFYESFMLRLQNEAKAKKEARAAEFKCQESERKRSQLQSDKSLIQQEMRELKTKLEKTKSLLKQAESDSQKLNDQREKQIYHLNRKAREMNQSRQDFMDKLNYGDDLEHEAIRIDQSVTNLAQKRAQNSQNNKDQDNLQARQIQSDQADTKPKTNSTLDTTSPILRDQNSSVLLIQEKSNDVLNASSKMTIKQVGQTDKPEQKQIQPQQTTQQNNIIQGNGGGGGLLGGKKKIKFNSFLAGQ